MANPTQTPQEHDAEVMTAALERAGRRARLLAAQTRTRLIVYRNGKTVAEAVPLSELQSEPGPIPISRL